MCLSVPSKIVEIHDDASVTVDTLGVKRRVSSHLMTEPLSPGDYVLIHIGFVMNKIDEKDAQQSLDLYQEIVEKMQLESE
ncbi:HypC/HybG/HupF family hydrogenase formation chaperone [Shewanella inventionis]|jgi:hydrogenase expression/formation protein HypC|uniref:Hydrogenase assembly protein HypC n=1 Tax=Shewanella inventionis TaxID=1738770 RepID=A0ABQ1JMW6_9GAMM|nr:HypC/HybG/HupF family hydrogenase formation chaperone [Shewanella inventionis]MCL1159601.1 HypC/HybG/HupF family hydrogenase formation chaperone [Shewanella inventionis]UAL41694.1 HypC/HybG/HupF family hydrogenase formation chaperone [Shewanella inventionis]GGB70241.1 hydrogenase assembly protein HypC [Shewanella inventionis]